MQATALGHRLETLHDGLATFCDGNPVPVPLVASNISVRVVSGLAFVRTTRSFHNTERNAIEAVMTFPVGFDAVVTGLAATIDGRRMIGVAKERSEARETYEAALDEGKLSVLHEEALRGIHVLSVGTLPPGAKVLVELEQTVPLADVGGVPFLRLPMTAGQLYGTSPLLPSDDLVTANVRHVADLSVTVDAGCALLHGQPVVPDQTLEIVLDRAVELRIEGGSFGQLSGTAADGRKVTLALEPIGLGDAALDLHVIVDRSGSTSSVVQDGTISVWQAMRDGLEVELAKMHAADRVSLWQFDGDCQFLGASCGPASAKLAKKLEGPSGGTELAGAIRAALAKGARDILVLTDGQTWAHMVEDLKGEGPRISAVLVGPQSLDANIGHLCALTGGQVLYAPGRDVASALRSTFAALRQVGAAVQGQITEAGPTNLMAVRAGVKLRAEWSPQEQDATLDSPAVGRFAAALALPLLPADKAETFARAHSLCTHLTSLVLIDDAGVATEGFSRMRKVPLMESWNLALDTPLTGPVSIARIRPGGIPRPEALIRRSHASVPPNRVRFEVDPRGAQSIRQTRATPSREGALRRILDWLRREKKTSDLTEFDGFAWDTHGDALLAGDLTILDVGQIAVVKEFTQRILAKFSELGATSAPIDNASILALGLIAHQSAERIAERFARRALKDAPPWLRDLAGAKQ
jgi:hypothetical protein